jgi:uncharacterized protein DUF3618
MSTQPGGEPQDVNELRADIMVTRQELSATLSELSAKANIPARAKEKVNATAGSVWGRVPEPARHAAQRTGHAVAPAVGAIRPYRKQIGTGLGVAAVIAWVIRRRRSRNS